MGTRRAWRRDIHPEREQDLSLGFELGGIEVVCASGDTRDDSLKVVTRSRNSNTTKHENWLSLGQTVAGRR